MYCTECQSSDTVKYGRNFHGKQQYRCKTCKKIFTVDDKIEVPNRDISFELTPDEFALIKSRTLKNGKNMAQYCHELFHRELTKNSKR